MLLGRRNRQDGDAALTQRGEVGRRHFAPMLQHRRSRSAPARSSFRDPGLKHAARRYHLRSSEKPDAKPGTAPRARSYPTGDRSMSMIRSTTAIVLALGLLRLRCPSGLLRPQRRSHDPLQ